MRNIQKEYMPVRAHYSAMFFCAVRDSFTPEQPAITSETNRQVAYDRKQNDLNRVEARAYIREMSMATGESGDGFGHVYSVLQYLGCAEFHPEKFLKEMERIWAKIDADPAHGRYMINQIIRPILALGIVEQEEFIDEFGLDLPNAS